MNNTVYKLKRLAVKAPVILSFGAAILFSSFATSGTAAASGDDFEATFIPTDLRGPVDNEGLGSGDYSELIINVADRKDRKAARREYRGDKYERRAEREGRSKDRKYTKSERRGEYNRGEKNARQHHDKAEKHAVRHEKRAFKRSVKRAHRRAHHRSHAYYDSPFYYRPRGYYNRGYYGGSFGYGIGYGGYGHRYGHSGTFFSLHYGTGGNYAYGAEYYDRYWHRRHAHNHGYSIHYYDDCGSCYSGGSGGFAGAVVGGLIGGVIGAEIDGGYDKTAGAVIGAAIGATAGYEIGRDGDRSYRGSRYDDAYEIDRGLHVPREDEEYSGEGDGYYGRIKDSQTDYGRSYRPRSVAPGTCLSYRFEGGRYVCTVRAQAEPEFTDKATEENEEENEGEEEQ